MINGKWWMNPPSTVYSYEYYIIVYDFVYTFWDTLYKLSVLFYPILKCIAVYLLIAKLNDI